jgi:hypothetical protein
MPLPPESNGAATIVPAVPGLETDVTPLPAPDAAAADPASGTPAAGATATDPAAAAQNTYRRRAVRRQVPAGEQVLRALQNSTQ